MGFDLNRNWHQISEWAHPTLFAFQQMIADLDMNKVHSIRPKWPDRPHSPLKENFPLFQSVSLDFILDLHANTTLPGVFVYGNTYDDVYRRVFFPCSIMDNKYLWNILYKCAKLFPNALCLDKCMPFDVKIPFFLHY